MTADTGNHGHGHARISDELGAIEGFADRARSGFDRLIHHAPETGPNPIITTEETVTTPAPTPPQSILQRMTYDIAAIGSEVSGMAENPLITKLHEHDLGKRLEAAEIETVISFVAGLEGPRQLAETAAQH